MVETASELHEIAQDPAVEPSVSSASSDVDVEESNKKRKLNQLVLRGPDNEIAAFRYSSNHNLDIMSSIQTIMKLDDAAQGLADTLKHNERLYTLAMDEREQKLIETERELFETKNALCSLSKEHQLIKETNLKQHERESESKKALAQLVNDITADSESQAHERCNVMLKRTVALTAEYSEALHTLAAEFAQHVKSDFEVMIERFNSLASDIAKEAHK